MFRQVMQCVGMNPVKAMEKVIGSGRYLPERFHEQQACTDQNTEKIMRLIIKAIFFYIPLTARIDVSGLFPDFFRDEKAQSLKTIDTAY